MTKLCDIKVSKQLLKGRNQKTTKTWLWIHPRYGTGQYDQLKWKNAIKFHNLMWKMHRIYAYKTSRLFEEKQIGSTKKFILENKF